LSYPVKGIFSLLSTQPAGIHFGVFNPFFNNTTVILPLPGIPPTGEALLEIVKHTTSDWETMAPLTLEGISKDENLLDEISQRLKMLLFSAGSLSKVFGDVIAAKIKLTSLLGSSESGPIPSMYPLGNNFGRDWYIQIHPALGAKFEDSAGVAELVWELLQRPSPTRPCSRYTLTYSFSVQKICLLRTQRFPTLGRMLPAHMM
jgi:hypothetical protein